MQLLTWLLDLDLSNSQDGNTEVRVNAGLALGRRGGRVLLLLARGPLEPRGFGETSKGPDV